MLYDVLRLSAALVARRAFHFSSIDGTRLGWSSASLAICLSSLTALHEEHESKLISSFYPFRLTLSGDEFQNKVDLYAGVIRLNPAATLLQWLGIISEVSHNNVVTLKNNLKELKCNQSEVEHAFGLRVIKGHTCCSEEYHKCMKRLAMEISQNNSSSQEDKSALTISNKKSKIIIESSQTCRRGRQRKHDGSFEVGASMNSMQILSIIGKFASKSNRIIEEQSKHQERCKELINRVMYTYGVEKIKQVSSTVTSEQMSQALSILLNKDEGEQQELRGYLAGQSIGIVGHGQLCHIGDDGSIYIPTNCS